jgi:hypothetical protein
MKYLKRFSINESEFFRIDESDINNILDIFKDELQDDGFEFLQKNYSDISPGEVIYMTSIDILDDRGDNEYKSRHFTSLSSNWLNDSDNKLPILNKHFNYYQTIIFNVNFEGYVDHLADDVMLACNRIYDRLISSGYVCQLHSPNWKRLRFHICTKESNPFLVGKNLSNY